MTSYVAIQTAIERAVSANGGKAYIRPSAPQTSPAVRTALQALARACGVTDPLPLTSEQLCMLYATTRKNMEAGVRLGADWQSVAELNQQEGPNPLLDTPTPAPEAPTDTFDPFTPEATPETPQQAPTVDLEAVRGIARTEARNVSNELLGDALDGLESTVAELALKAVRSIQPTNLIVTLPEQAPSVLGTVHREQANLIAMLAAGCNVYMHGPAGSGKTTAGQKAAEAFKCPFYFSAKVESEYLLLGFKDAKGETVRTPFREAYEHGGLFLFDEMDASGSGAIVAMNAALANGYCPFPDGTVQRHDAFKCIGAGNTVLTGANRQYTGRTALDAASIDRFAFLSWGYDEALETALAGNKDWCAYVQRVRAAITERALDHLVTPRATIDGGKLLAAGLSWEYVEGAVLWKGLDADTVWTIKQSIGA